MISAPRSRWLPGLPGMNPSSRIPRIRWCREKKSASRNRRLRERLNRDRLARYAFRFRKTGLVNSGWGTLRQFAADVRLCRRSALFTASSARTYGLQRNATELETRPAGGSDAARKMVGSLSGSPAQRARREDQYFEPEPEGGAGSV